MRVSLAAHATTCAVLALSLWTSSARAQAGGAAAGAPAPTCVAGLEVVVGPPTIDPARARRVLEEMASELGPQRATTCEGAATRIAIDWSDEARARVVVEAQEGGEVQRATRTLDLANIAEDGRPLAIAIAADELAREMRGRLAITPDEPEPAHGPLAIAREPPSSRRTIVRAPRTLSIGPALAVDAFTSGVALVGPDARFAWSPGKHAIVGARVGLRAAETNAESRGLRSAIVGGMSVAFAPGDARARRGVGVEVALDLVSARAGSTTTPRATLVPSAGIVAWWRVLPSLALTVDLRGGAVLAPLHVSREDGARASLSGVAILPSIGVVSTF